MFSSSSSTLPLAIFILCLFTNGSGNTPPPPHGNPTGNNPFYNNPHYSTQPQQVPNNMNSNNYYDQGDPAPPKNTNRNVDSIAAGLDQAVESVANPSVGLKFSPSESPTSPSGSQLYGEDLSQMDKDIIFEGLKNLYRKKVLPLETASKYSHFASPPMGPSDFDAKPMVLILGQYSVGKTSFISSLVQQDFPGQRIGPEPTTDRFTAIMHAERDGAHDEGLGRLVPGHALVMQNDKPFQGLSTFGNNFLSKFEGAEVPATILRNITIVDTPGVLAGEKQRIGRDYDFSEVIKWFAERADMIIIMFDAHKLDISDELREVLDTLKPHSEKLRVLLNKADTMDSQALLRVYGALMWSLGKVVGTPEVCRVYLGSFWDMPLKMEENRALLDREKSDLLNEMMSLPLNAVVRRINELVKRARAVKVHAYIIHYLKKQMPYMMGKSEKQAKLLGRLDKEFAACARRYNLPRGDFPNVERYRRILSEIKDISDFKKLDKSMVAEMDKVLTHDIPQLLKRATASSTRSFPPPSQMAQQPDANYNAYYEQTMEHSYSQQRDPRTQLDYQQQQYQQQHQQQPHGYPSNYQQQYQQYPPPQ